MGALSNAKHERYAQGVAKGLSQTQAYTDAGYIGDETAASRLSRNDKVKARVAELLENASMRAEISVASVTADLLRIAQKAEKLGDAAGFQAARASLVDAAKVNGLIIDKSQVTEESVQRIISDRPQTDEEWASAHGADLGAAAGAATRTH